MFGPLRHILDRTITTGRLTLVDADGRRFGCGEHSGPAIVARIADKRTEWELAFHPALTLGEAYMDGRLIIEQGTIYDFIELLAANAESAAWPRWLAAVDCLRFLTRRWEHVNPRSRARRNVEHHYDLESSLYNLFFDLDRQYSCAYFEHDAMSLDAAQPRSATSPQSSSSKAA
jgi:cyclopropane-fatty-acyl-phospholipid synthase